jgi:hypothetical protein
MLVKLCNLKFPRTKSTRLVHSPLTVIILGIRKCHTSRYSDSVSIQSDSKVLSEFPFIDQNRPVFTSKYFACRDVVIFLKIQQSKGRVFILRRRRFFMYDGKVICKDILRHLPETS